MHHNLGLGMQLGLKGNKIICLVVVFFFKNQLFFCFRTHGFFHARDMPSFEQRGQI